MINLGIIGTGLMGHSHAEDFSELEGCALTAVCDVDLERAQTLADAFDIPGVYTEVDALLADDTVDAVVVATPDALHAPIALKAAAARKHILCEKPLALNHAEAAQMTEAAREAGVINMVNFSYRRAPALQKARTLVAEGAIGQLRHFEAHYLQSWLTSDAWGDWQTEAAWLWRLSTAHGSQGVLGDIGVHALDFLSYPAGDFKSVHCWLKTFSKAEGDRIGDYVLDANDSALILAEMTNGAAGVVHLSRWATGYRNALALTLHGGEGALRIDLERDENTLELCRGKNIDEKIPIWEPLACEKTPTNAERFLESIRTGLNDQPDFARGAAIQNVLDACFASDALGTAVRL